MFAFASDGYGREIVALFVLTVLLTAAVAGGVGTAADRWFTAAVESLVGVPGEYDVIVHVQPAAGRGAVQALKGRLEEIAPGFRLKEGPALFGRLNVFVGFPDAKRTAESFETLESALRDLPGFDGISFIVEPSILVKDVHPALLERYSELAAQDPEVRFTFQRGNNLWVVAGRAAEADGVRRRLEVAARRLGILDVRLPAAVSEAELADLERRVQQAAESAYPAVVVSPLGTAGSEAVRDLLEVKRLLAGVAESDWDELERALERAEEAIAQAAGDGSVREDIAAALDAFEQAVAQLENLERRAVELREQIKVSAGSDGTLGVVIALLLERLASGLQGEQPAVADRQPADIEQLKSGIASLAERLASIESLDFETLIDGVRRFEESLAPVSDGAGERVLALIDRAIEAQGGEGARVEFLVEGDWMGVDPALVAQMASVEPAEAYTRPAAVVEPDPRTTLSNLIDRAGRAVTLAAGLLVASVLFLLDAATIVSFLQLGPASTGRPARPRRLFVASMGGAWLAMNLGAAMWLAGGGEGISWAAPAFGFGLGSILALAAHKVAPVDRDEVQAGLSLGLVDAQILREIVVPGGRPGLLIWLNDFGRRVPAAVRR